MAALSDPNSTQYNHGLPAPRVSIVTSVYNGAPFLAESIQSILRQTFTDFEFILVDDGSQDETWEIIQQFASQDPRVTPIHNEINQGVVAGLNQGLAAARGAYIARQDADDLSLPDRIARQVEFLDAHAGYGLVACRVAFIDAVGRLFNRSNPFLTTGNVEIQKNLVESMCLCGPSIMMRREALEAAGFWFGAGLDASEDYDLCLRLAEVTQVDNLPQPLYLYRQHAQSASIKQEYKQVLHTAVALENAQQRRTNRQPVPINPSTVGETYYKAGVLAFANGDEAAARRCMAKMLEFYPEILTQPQTIERILRYRMPPAAEAALQFVRVFFAKFLPQTPTMKRLQSELLSSIHMKEVFAGARCGERDRVKQHLWAGLYENPRWLMNKGVLSIALRYRIFGR